MGADMADTSASSPKKENKEKLSKSKRPQSPESGGGGRRGGTFSLIGYFWVVLLLFAVMSVYVNTQHTKSTSLPSLEHLITIENSLRDSFLVTSASSRGDVAETTSTSIDTSNPHEGKPQYDLAGLSCEKFGGPSPSEAKEMVYWRDIPSDNRHVSPLKKSDQEFLTFEPDHGGWNNIRMGMETVLGLAFAMGRTLVLPPEKPLYLLGKRTHHKTGDKQRNKFSFAHFFHMEAIHEEHVGLNIVTMKEFLEQQAMTGKLLNRNTGKPSFPPGNRTDWDGVELDPLFTWLRNTVGIVAPWNPEKCVAAFPSSTDPKDLEKLRKMETKITANPPKFEDFVGKPVPVNGSAFRRLRENWAARDGLCLYDDELQSAPLVHFTNSVAKGGGRLLVHFYAFLFFQDWHADLWMKRFVRDHVRYMDEIQCGAARIVAAIRQRSRDRNEGGIFDSMHVRRGDFQYKLTRVSANEMLEQVQKVVPKGATLYISTDERKKAFFDPLQQYGYDVIVLEDFHHLLEGINTNYYGMIDQLIASRGRFFFGCWFSTFTGYINRIRGYHATQDRIAGHEDGIIPSWYYVLADRFDHMQTYYPVKKVFYAREFPTSWRLIDADLNDGGVNANGEGGSGGLSVVR